MNTDELLKTIETTTLGFMQLLEPYLNALSIQVAHQSIAENRTAEDLIARYLQLKSHYAKQAETVARLMDKKLMEALSDQLLIMLQKVGSDSFTTDAGTAYKSVLMSPKINDREQFLDWCLDRWDGIGGDMMQIGAPKVEAVRRYLQENGGELPPGIETSTYTKVNIRTS